MFLKVPYYVYPQPITYLTTDYLIEEPQIRLNSSYALVSQIDKTKDVKFPLIYRRGIENV